MTTRPTALITGGASGIGEATARAFATSGHHVVIADINPEAGRAVADEIGGIFVRTDVREVDDNDAAVAQAITTYGRLDLVHLNAGIGGGTTFGPDFDLGRYRDTVAVNLDGVVFGLQAALPALRDHGGAVVVSASLSGLVPSPHDPVYAATKHALVGLVRAMADPLRAHGITINAFCPSFVDTPLIAPALEFLAAQKLAVSDVHAAATAVRTIIASGHSGQAWTLIGNQEPTPWPFPDIPDVGTG